MAQKLVIILTTLPFLLIIWISVYSQEDMRVVDNSPFDDPRRPPATFNHDAHNEQAELEECNECHHIYENGVRLDDESSEDQRCVDCHAVTDQNDRPALMKAFHQNCKGCHQQRKAGPVMCGECHEKHR